MADGSIETLSNCCFAWVGRFDQTIAAITATAVMPIRVRIEVSLGFGRELLLSIYPHTNFDYPDALCRPSQKERRTESFGIGMRKLNLYLGAIRRERSRRSKPWAKFYKRASGPIFGRLVRRLAHEVYLRNSTRALQQFDDWSLADILCPLSRSLLGVKRTSLFALHMSAFDPKRTFQKCCFSPGFRKPLWYQNGLFCSAWLCMEWHNPIRLSARRVHPQDCSSKIARQIGLREFGQADFVSWTHICITSCKQDGNVRPFASDDFGEFRSGHFRHGLISNDKVNGILAPQDFERIFAGISLKDGMAQIFKHGHRIHQD